MKKTVYVVRSDDKPALNSLHVLIAMGYDTRTLSPGETVADLKQDEPEGTLFIGLQTISESAPRVQTEEAKADGTSPASYSDLASA